jgi:hypothetical protein
MRLGTRLGRNFKEDDVKRQGDRTYCGFPRNRVTAIKRNRDGKVLAGGDL